MNSKLETLKQVAEGTLSLDDAAARHGVSRETIADWGELVIDAARPRWRPSKPLLSLLVIFGALGLAGAARAACNAPTFGNLIGVCADAPATAGDYNANLQRIDGRLDGGVQLAQQTRAEVAAKIGALGTAGVTLQSPMRFSGCSGGEVPFAPNDGGAIDCQQLYSNAGTPLITAWETGDLQAVFTTNTLSLGSTANQICVLSDVHFTTSFNSNNDGRCLVERTGTSWTLYAIGSGSTATCRARCIQFNF